MDLQDKFNALKTALSELPSVLVAFSGGVDSTFLLAAAHDVLGANAVAVTARNAASPKRETEEAEAFCKLEGIEQVFIDNDVFAVDAFRFNAKDRCYHCKSALLAEIKRTAAERGIAHVAEGSNVDDDGDYRPGHRAITEHGALSPLRDAGLTKAEIRELSRQRGLATWDKPSIACLATRFPYGEELTAEKLSSVDAAERFLHDLGIAQVRVRSHGDAARIEADDNGFALLTRDEKTRRKVYGALKEYGFSHVALDLMGYRTGSMNG